MDATRVGAVVFSERNSLVIRLNQYDNAEDIQNAITSINYLGETTNTPGQYTGVNVSAIFIKYNRGT